MQHGIESSRSRLLQSALPELPAGILTTLLDHVPFGVALVEASELRFVYANPVYEGWLAPSRRPLVGQTATEILTVATGVIEVFRKAAADGREQHFHRAEFVGLPGPSVTLPGDVTIWDWSIYPLRVGQGGVTHLLLTGVDVTRSEIERLRLLSLEESKSDFLGLAAHELRGPLAVLNGYLSMLESGSIKGVGGAAAETIPILAGQARRMSLLVDQMLEVARLEDERLELRVTEFDLRDAARAALSDLRLPEGSSHGLALNLPPRSVPVRGDWDRVLLILANLLDNAIKYSPEGGPVACRVSGARGTGAVVVSDRGVGIPADQIGRLFTRFSRLPGTEHLPGTGLGLYLCRRLARRMDGDVTVRSEAGAGSAFRLRLPAH